MGTTGSYTPDAGIQYVSGVLRPDGAGGWTVLDDGPGGAHRPEGGLAIINVTATQLIVGYDPLTTIHTASATDDEVLGRLGFTLGPSVGLTQAAIEFGRNGAQVDPRTITNTLSNVWFWIRGR